MPLHSLTSQVRKLSMWAQQNAEVAAKHVAWIVYILECSDGSFYAGITNNLERRLQQHNKGRASRYTRGRLPVKIIHQEYYLNRAQALIREMVIKSLPRAAKEKLIETHDKSNTNRQPP